MLVDFMVIGAQKSGTTSLAVQLAQHPKICFSSVKEPGFFNESEDWKAGLERYHRLYQPEKGQLCGEGSTMYTFLPEWPETRFRLHAYNPELKLIYIMRQPVERLISHYAHNLVRGLEQRSPEEAVIEDARYMNRSRYGVQILPFVELFGLENILLLVFEEYVVDQMKILGQVADFLGIEVEGFAEADMSPQHKTVGRSYLKNESVARLTQTGLFKSVRTIVPERIRHAVRQNIFANILDSMPVFSPELTKTIWRFLADDVRTVETLLGRSLPSWRQGIAI